MSTLTKLCQASHHLRLLTSGNGDVTTAVLIAAVKTVFPGPQCYHSEPRQVEQHHVVVVVVIGLVDFVGAGHTDGDAASQCLLQRDVRLAVDCW